MFRDVPACSGFYRRPCLCSVIAIRTADHKILHAWLVKQSKNTSFLERLSCILNALAKGYHGYKSNFGFVFAQRNPKKHTHNFFKVSEANFKVPYDVAQRLSENGFGNDIINSRGKRMIVIMLCRERREISLTLPLVNCHDLTMAISIFD